MEKSFNEYYLTESAKEYKFKLKFAVNEWAPEQTDKLERALSRYDLRSITTFKETPIQESPLDFPNIKNTKVFVTEIVLGYPATLDMLRRFVADKTCVHEAAVAVYSANDPRDVYTAEWLERMSPEFKEAYTPRLGSDPEQTVVPAYGAEQTKDLLDQMAKERAERKIHNVENPLMPKQKIDNSELHGEMTPPGPSYSVLGNRKK